MTKHMEQGLEFENKQLISRVDIIEGLEDALKKYSFDMPDMSDYESVGHYLDDIAEYRKASSIVEKAARAYAELQKGN